MRVQYLQAGLLALLLLVAGCVPAQAHVSYTLTGCDPNIPMEELASWAGVEIQARDGVIHVQQRIAYVCCADIHVSLEQEGSTLRLIERNEGEVCRCMCGYQVTMEISGLPTGRYRVQVWGVEYPDVHPLELLGEATVDL